MTGFELTKHAEKRMAQRGISKNDLDLILLIGDEVEDGFLVRKKDIQELERKLRSTICRLHKLCGKRVVCTEGRILTVYHASNQVKRNLIRHIQ